jgi:hypothetical protein
MVDLGSFESWVAPSGIIEIPNTFSPKMTLTKRGILEHATERRNGPAEDDGLPSTTKFQKSWKEPLGEALSF